MHDVLYYYLINIFTSKYMQCTLHINDRSTGQRKVSGGRSEDSGGWPDQCGLNPGYPVDLTIDRTVCN